MKKHIMLGVNGNNCCLLSCLLGYNQLDFENLDTSDFCHTSTNWGGCDTLERTFEVKKMHLTGNCTKLEKPLVFRGCDYDWGRSYRWEFAVNEIYEVEER